MRITSWKVEYEKGDVRGKNVFRSNGSNENDDLRVEVSSAEINGGTHSVIRLLPKAEITLRDFSLQTDAKLSGDHPVFLNGYQTWTDSREFRIDETIPKIFPLALPIMGMYGDYEFYKYKKNKLHSWTYTYIRGGGDIILIGSLSEKVGFTIFEYDKKEKSLCIIKDCAGLKVSKAMTAFDLFVAQGEEGKAFDSYFKTGSYASPRATPCTGWTSWYNYYTKVTQANVLENLAAFQSRQLPIDIFQIDDGYQHAVGDWLSINEKFPDGMQSLADKIKQSGYQAGLWLAPIICEKTSDIYKNHKSWVLGKAGYNPGWSGYFYVLDFYNEEVREYLRKVFDTVFNKWRYDLVKLDFLYAAALIQREDKTRGQIMCELMEFLRELAGDKLILGCGVPLGAAFGLVDYCRVSSDVALSWEYGLGKRIRYRERVSTINALTSTIGRRHLDRRAFLNDPDVFILRSTNNSLTVAQRYTLFLLNVLLGSLTFTSDNINEYSEQELELFTTMLHWKNKQLHSVSQGDTVNITFSAHGSEFAAFCNLREKAVTVSCENAGTLLQSDKAVSRGEKLTLQPFASLCMKITMQ